MIKHLCIVWAFGISVVSVQAQNLISATPLGAKTQAQLLAQFNNLPFIQYGAKYYRITYTTPDVHGILDTVTGLLAVPDQLNKKYPRLVYQHGTSGERTAVPSLNYEGGEGQVGLLFAGLGYVALLPDYLGLGNVSRGFHPYVHAASEASAALDMLRSVAVFCAQQQIFTNSQLFITGYSQGGHAAMALHRAIEKDPSQEFVVTAAAHLSGPYSISGVMRDLILSDDVYYYPAYIPNTALSYQTVYGNLFNQVSDIFNDPYAGLIQSFYDGEISLSSLNEALIAALIDQEGASRPFRMLHPNVVQAVMNDPQHPINQALSDNDTYNDWTPQSPMRIYYCMNDDQVPFQNSIVATDTLTAVGAPNFMSNDVMPSADHGACYVPAVTGTLFFFLGFQQFGTLDAEEQAFEPSLEISPNPAATWMELKGAPAGTNVQILDLSGRKLLETTVQDASSLQIQVGHLEEGMYAVRCAHNGNVSVSKLLLQR